MRRTIRISVPIAVLLLSAAGAVAWAGTNGVGPFNWDRTIDDHGEDLQSEGREIFRFDTFGSEQFWGDTLLLHEAIETSVSPAVALQLGLKVDVEALPGRIKGALKSGRLDLDDPANTVELLRHDAVVGLDGIFNDDDELASVGITCALCHSTVNDSLTEGVGERLDGWANRDLDIGAIIAAAPNLQPVVDLLRNAPSLTALTEEQLRELLRTWGPGRFDAEVLHDGKAINPETGQSAPTLIPPAFGLAGINLHTFTGFGSVPYWNAFVAVTEMQGQGTFFDPRLNDPEKFPIDAATGRWNIRSDPDLVTSKLAALHFYQLSIPAPEPPPGSFDADAASRGEDLFSGAAGCAECHVPPLYTEPGYAIHTPEEIGIDDFQANRSPTEGYRTTPLAGLWSHTKGGFYHDGRFATLSDVVEHYDQHFGLGLTPDQINDLAEFLKSL
ncbi:MAG TPA: hypothetical protein VJ948_00910 [Acidimicrobiia bacterium]|nr:hypothetical protein [Acidimicrobiia bacterium]